MVILDIDMPESCEKCYCVGQFCGYTEDGDVFLFFCPDGGDVTRKDRKGPFTFRPDWCPMVEVEEKKIRERTSHTTWEEKTVYVRKDNAEKKR